MKLVTKYLRSDQHKLWPWLAIGLVLLISLFQLRNQGRAWICSCGEIYWWVGDIWSSDNSQHLSDPYSFSHILHGFVFYWVLTWVFPKLSATWRLALSLTIEAAWELVENSPLIINRYREATAALGYEGDTIVNAMSDIVMAGLGFLIAQYLGFRRSLILFILTELILIILIRDSLILNVFMLIYPIDAIRVWQLDGQ